MKKINTTPRLCLTFFLSLIISGCAVEPPKSNDVVRGAPDWVDRGNVIIVIDNQRLFYGVSRIPPQGDLALQKSVAHEQAMIEAGKVLGSYLDRVATLYVEADKNSEREIQDDSDYRANEIDAKRQIQEGMNKQIDAAIARQFTQPVSPQLRNDILNSLKDTSKRHINYAISDYLNFSMQIEADISRQIVEAVSRQIRNTIKEASSNARIYDTWRDPRTNIVWSLAELNLPQVKASLIASNDLNTDVKRFFEKNAESIYDLILKEKEEAESGGFFSIFK